MNLPLYSLSFKIKGGLELDDSYEGHIGVITYVVNSNIPNATGLSG